MSVHSSHPDIIKRLKRAEGHLRSIVAMLEDGRDCLEHAVEGAGTREAIREFKAITKYL